VKGKGEKKMKKKQRVRKEGGGSEATQPEKGGRCDKEQKLKKPGKGNRVEVKWKAHLQGKTPASEKKLHEGVT